MAEGHPVAFHWPVQAQKRGALDLAAAAALAGGLALRRAVIGLAEPIVPADSGSTA